MPHLAGGKFSGSHSTIIEAAIPVAKAAAKLACVSKIALGVIKRIKGRAVAKRLKITELDAGLLVTVRGSKSIQELYIYTNDRERTTQTILAAL